VKFIFADALDMIDPGYDFIADRSARERTRYWSDKYPHEFFRVPPYDGVLVSRGVVGDHRLAGKYSESQAMRFRRVGAREFLRLNDAKFKHFSIFGDCGAFSYVNAAEPPYTSEEMVEFYADGRFSHGCSVDHIIFDFDPTLTEGMGGGNHRARARFDLTQQNARDFLKAARTLGRGFTPLGVIQGWSPGSMAHAARNLERMGYTYLSVGGMVPLPSPAIHLCLDAIRRAIRPSIKLHILGFAKAEQIEEFTRYRIASFDSTSPLIRAFKDARANYYLPCKNGSLAYFTAIRIPQAIENARLLRKAKEGKITQERLSHLEMRALRAVRGYDQGTASLEDALDAVVAYNREFLWDGHLPAKTNERKVDETAKSVRATLEARPWRLCRCEVCRQAGVEVIIFRSSNRNKRRGFHNLAVYYQHLRRLH
jgi:hypothetical protein